MTAYTAQTEEGKGWVDNIPLRRSGTPEDVACTAIYLASPASAYLNGATLTLDAPPAARIPGRGPYSSLMDYNLGAALRRGLAATRDGDAAEALRARDQLATRAPNDRRLYELERAIVDGFRPIIAEHLRVGRCAEAQALYSSLAARGLAQRADELFGDNRCPLPTPR